MQGHGETEGERVLADDFCGFVLVVGVLFAGKVHFFVDDEPKAQAEGLCSDAEHGLSALEGDIGGVAAGGVACNAAGVHVEVDGGEVVPEHEVRGVEVS